MEKLTVEQPSLTFILQQRSLNVRKALTQRNITHSLTINNTTTNA